MKLIDGKAAAAALRAEVKAKVAARLAAGQRAPCLAVVLVGDDPASHVYVRNKVKACAEAGIASIERRLQGTATEADVLAVVHALNADRRVDGILVQLPLPPQCDAARVIAAIAPDKDVDGLTPVSAGRLAHGAPGFIPCTPAGCLKLLDSFHGDLAGAEAVVIGRSVLVGRPMAALLLNRSATVTVAHSKTRDLPQVARRADVLVAAVGQPGLVRRDWVKPGATVIDVGINRVTTLDGSARLVGDVAFDEVAEVAGALTPVPGGVGPMTIACLLDNTLAAAA
ncbi:bifunctional methylenetetrahydrofolate dehydrogenase/methenyltetrahydrofolate cyclohydrolase FolD [Thermaurantiacus sp.]